MAKLSFVKKEKEAYNIWHFLPCFFFSSSFYFFPTYSKGTFACGGWWWSLVACGRGRSVDGIGREEEEEGKRGKENGNKKRLLNFYKLLSKSPFLLNNFKYVSNFALYVYHLNKWKYPYWPSFFYNFLLFSRWPNCPLLEKKKEAAYDIWHFHLIFVFSSSSSSSFPRIQEETLLAVAGGGHWWLMGVEGECMHGIPRREVKKRGKNRKGERKMTNERESLKILNLFFTCLGIRSFWRKKKVKFIKKKMGQPLERNHYKSNNFYGRLIFTGS